MNSFLNVLLGNLILKKGPQDLPFSVALMRLSLMVYFITGLPGLISNGSFEQAVFIMALDVLVLLVFMYLCLMAFSKSGRFVQSVTGMAIIGSVFQLLVLPLLLNFDTDPKAAESMLNLSLLLLLIVSWNLAVYAHVFRESFGVRLPAAMVLTVCYIVITMLVKKLFFPELV